MRVQVLGSMEVRDPDPVPLGGPTQRRTFGMLLIHCGRTVSIDQLVDGIWVNGDAPDRAEQNVPKYVHRLRTVFAEHAERIQTVGAGYRLDLEPDELDATRFERLIDEARAATTQGDSGRALHLLDEALALWKGRPYDDVADLDWARAEVARLSELHASAVERRFELLLGEGRHTELVGPLQEAIGDEPWRERRRAQLALALYRAGRQAEALRVLRDFRAELVDELGLDPSAELDELEHRILDQDPTLLPGSQRRHAVRGYELGEVIGEGAFSLVWRGTQPTLGRAVAVKQIRAELANQAEFIRGFETEAQTIAALEHPHIVPLYDYWREPDSAFLVMRYIGGGSLESAVLSGPLDEARLRRMIEQVGSALHTAHRAGVLHRDVKSANVLLDDDGNFYLSDFGIAFTGVDDELAASLSTGSPAYAAPEQLRRQDLDPRSDVYSFGVTVFEAATGRLPFVDAPTQAAMIGHQLNDPVPTPSSIDPSVPIWVDDIVARATAKNPGDRFTTVDDLLAAVPPPTSGRSDGGGSAWPTLIDDVVNPFKALRPFRESDAADFHGRDRLITRFVQVLERPGAAGRMLAAVGPSGSGKSSVVRSGLVPALRRGAIPGSERWFVATMIPGSHPFESLEAALTRVASRPTGPLVEMMRTDTRGISRALGQVLPDEESELVLVIDQFEELFTLADDATRTAFIDGLLTAVREPRAGVRVVLTIRADFWDRPLRHPQLAARLETAAVSVSPLSPDELEAAIVEPVRRQGMHYEPGLVARIIADVGDQPGALPLLQYALTELFDRQVSGLILGEAYDEIGGLAGALAKRAEATLATMSDNEQGVARRLFCRLVTLGKGTEDTRRRVRLAELGDETDTQGVIAAFGESRMLVFDVDPTTREPTVEISHEALLRAWPRLRRWLDDDREGLRIHRHLTEAATGWLVAGRDPGELYRGGRLEAVEAWAAGHRGDLNAAEHDFLQASIAARQAELDAEAERFEEQVRHNRRLRTLVAVATVIAVIAAAAGVFALGQRSRANDEAAAAKEQADEAVAAADEADAATAEAEAARARADDERRRAEAERRQADVERVRATAFEVAETDPALAALLAAEAHRIDPGVDSLSALHQLLGETDGIERVLPLTAQQIWTADGGRTAVILTVDGIELWDLESGARTGRLLEDRLAVASRSRRIDVADATGLLAISDAVGTDVYDLDSGEAVWSGPPDANDVVFSTDGTQLAVARDTGTGIWNVAAGNPTAPISALRSARTVAWHPRGEGFMVITPDNAVEYWPASAVEAAWTEPGVIPDRQPPMILFSPDGSDVVVTHGPAGTPPLLLVVRMMSVADGSPSGIGGLQLAVNDLLWLPGPEEQRHLALFDRGTIFSSYDARTGDFVEAPFDAVTATSAAYSESLGRFVVGSQFGVTVHDPAFSGPLERRITVTPGEEANPGFFDPFEVSLRGGVADEYYGDDVVLLTQALSSDGERLLVSGEDFSAGPILGIEYDLAEERPGGRNTEIPGWYKGTGEFSVYTGAGFSGEFGYTMLDDDLQPVGETVLTTPDRPSPIPSPDGRYFVLQYNQLHPTDAVLHEATGRRVAELDVPGEGFQTTWSFSGNASRVIGYWQPFAGDITPWTMWDTETGEVVHEDDGTERSFPRLAGDTLYTIEPTDTGERNFTIQRLDPDTLEPLGAPLVGARAITRHILDDADSDLIVTYHLLGDVILWDRATGRQVGRTIPTVGEGSAQQSGDGSVLTYVTRSHASVWNVDTSTWADVACDFAGRNMTAEEWAEFGPETLEYRATCPEYPLDV